MHRTKVLALLASIGFTLIIGPILSAVALAADPVVVKPGDTLTSIARRTGVGISDLVAWNRISDPNRIYAGQRLRVEPASASPAGSAPAPAPAAPAPAAQPAEQTVHTVARGESLWTIARRYGTSVGAIASANGIADPGRIRAGQRLVIPGTTPPPAPPAAAPAPQAAPAAPAVSPPAAQPTGQTVHTVARGESLWTIARRYGTSVGAIASANGIGDAGRIFAGQRLTIPGPSAPPAAPSAPAAAAPAPASPAMPSSMLRLVAERDAVRAVIVEEAARFGVPAAFALAVAWHESGWRQNVVSSAGAIGVMQLLPTTADWVAQAMLGTPVDAGDLRQNVRAGVRLLAHYLARYDGNRDLVLAAYYQGQRAADLHGVYPVSRPYIASITLLEAIFSR